MWFERNPGAFIGGIGVNTVVSFVLLLITLIVSFVVFGADAGWGQLLAGPLLVAALVPLVFFRPSKMLWVAIELILVPEEDHEDRSHEDRSHEDTP